jgi:hypothetical protein
MLDYVGYDLAALRAVLSAQDRRGEPGLPMEAQHTHAALESRT